MLSLVKTDSLIALIEIDGTDALPGETRRTAEILRAVSDDTLRSAFLASVANEEPRIVTNDAAR